METMKDFEKELNASFDKFSEGSMVGFDSDEAFAWDKVVEYKEEGTVLTVTIDGVVKSGVIAYVEGLRGFIPASQLSLSYVEDLNKWLKKEVEAKVIEADTETKRLVLSCKALLIDKAKEEKAKKINAIAAGSVLEGTVDSLQAYGAFIDLGDGISGLVHISQISQKRIKKPSEVLNVGDTVTVKVLKVENGKISLSMKALEEAIEAPVEEEVFDYKEEGNAMTSLGSLLAGFTFDE